MIVGVLCMRMLNADILAGNGARQQLPIAVSRDAGEREHCPFDHSKGGQQGGGVFFITAL